MDFGLYEANFTSVKVKLHSSRTQIELLFHTGLGC
jgi:hypothetical protein